MIAGVASTQQQQQQTMISQDMEDLRDDLRVLSAQMETGNDRLAKGQEELRSLLSGHGSSMEQVCDDQDHLLISQYTGRCSVQWLLRVGPCGTRSTDESCILSSYILTEKDLLVGISEFGAGPKLTHD